MSVIFGAHISISKGLVKAVDEAHKLGCKVMQIFSQSPQSFRGISKKNLEAVDKAKERLKHHGIQVVSHSPYLINLAKDPVKEKYVADALKNDLEFINKLEGIGSVVHMGKKIKLTEEKALDNMEKNIKNILNEYKGNSKLILETSCGQGTELLYKIEDLGKFYQRFTDKEKERIGFCIDTCHVFVAGYDMRSAKKVKDFFKLFDENIGLDKLVLIHFNDSDKPFASHVDRHDDIGEGFIGKKDGGSIYGLKEVFKIAKKLSIPMTLETHDIEGDLKNVQSWKEYK